MILSKDKLQLQNLPDYEAWRKINPNKEFSLTDYVYGVHQAQQLHPDFFVALIELMWPTFVEIDKQIFLGQAFSTARYEQLQATVSHPREVEYWINLTILDGLFESKGKFYPDHAEYILCSIAEMWKVKLQKVYPEKSFTFFVIKDSESGDFGITFNQTA